MEIIEHHSPHATILELRGTFDFSSRQDFMDAIHRASRSPACQLIVDLHGITSSDDSALCQLVIAHQKLSQHHCRLCIAKPSHHMSAQLQSQKFPRIIPLFAAIEEALNQKNFSF